MSVKTAFRLVAVLGAVLVSVVTFAANEEIAERISPVGSLCMAGDSCAAAVVSVAAGPRSGAEVYNTKCMACHATGAAGAPKLGDAAAWGPRAAKGSDTLYNHALNGFNGMPAMGLCMDCSEDEIKAAVDYMVDGSK